LFLLFISYVKAQCVVIAIVTKCLCLPVALAASGRFGLVDSAVNFSMGLWRSFQPGGTWAGSNWVPLLSSVEVMLEVFEVVFRGCYEGSYCGRNIGIVMNACIPQKGLICI
jgi:hypothetical protein